MTLRVNIAAAAQEQLESLPATTAERLANHLKAIAELAHLQPILYSGDDVRMLHLQLGEYDVRYSVDTAGAEVTVTEIRRGEGPGAAP